MADTVVVGDYIKVIFGTKKHCCKVTRKRKESDDYLLIICVPVCEWKAVGVQGVAIDNYEEWHIRAKTAYFGKSVVFTYSLEKIYDLREEDYKLHEPTHAIVRMYTRKKVIDFLYEMTTVF